MTHRRGWVWALAFALVTAQALGLMHRVVHGPQAEIGHELAAQDCDHGHGWVAKLFSGHDDDSTCRLFDPLSHEGAPTVAAIVLPVVLSSFFIDFFAGEFLVRWAALFDARGPPTLR